MNARAALRSIAALLAAVAVLGLGAHAPVHAGGPLQIVNNAPVVYPNGGTALTLQLTEMGIILSVTRQMPAIRAG